MDPGQTIYNTLKGDGVPDPLSSIVVSQARHETNNFTSNVFNTCNNAFGYKAVYGALSCTQSPEGGNYEYYPGGVVDSAHEISRYLFRRVNDGSFPPLHTITTPEQYATLLKAVGYYGAPLSEYTAGIIRWFKLYSPGIIGAGSLLLIGFAIYLFTKKNSL
jgi:hypothetical protein